jgi:serine protease Do
MGLSFSIPIDVALKVKDDLQKFGRVSRGRLGVAIQTVSRELAESFGLKEAKGALVNSVEPGGPAAKAGMQSGDIILSVEGNEVEQSADLPRVIGDIKPGSSIRMRIWRQGANRDVRVALGEAPADQLAQAEPEKKEAPPTKLGLGVRMLTEAERKKLATENGLIVEQVQGPAARAGLRSGDVILALNAQPVRTVEQFRRLLETTGNNVALLVQRQDSKLYVPVQAS